jgi:hypothetical protein
MVRDFTATGRSDAPAGPFQRRDPPLDIGNRGGQFRVRAIGHALAVIADRRVPL